MSLKKQYRDLEMKGVHGLRTKVENNSYTCKHTNTKAIDLVHRDLTIIDDNLIFVDLMGNHSHVFTVGLEDLIDILEK